MTYTLRELAKRDLEEIWLYTLETWGIKQADESIWSIPDRFNWLAEQPQLGRVRDDIKPGYLSFPESEHVIFYKRTDSGVDIISIVHHSQDVVTHFD